MRTQGIVFDIKKYSIHDGPGIRTTVFFKGCPLRCWWCHNPESQNPQPETIRDTYRKRKFQTHHSNTQGLLGREVSVREIIQEIEKDIIFYDQSGGGVTFSGGEPLMQPDFLYALLQECRKRDIHTAVDTCGQTPPEILKNIAGHVDLFLYDLKLMDDEQHIRYTGESNKTILDNLRQISRNDSRIVVRIPVVPGITDGDDNIDRIIECITGLKNIHEISLLAYTHLGDEKYRRLNKTNRMKNVPSPSSEELRALHKKFEDRGFQVNVGG